MPEPYRTDQREEPARPSKRFDGTPGSLTLDLSAMRQRYLRIRDTPIGSIADTRILDSAKLLRQAFQSILRAGTRRWTCENVRGNAPIGAETCERLKRRTA